MCDFPIFSLQKGPKGSLYEKSRDFLMNDGGVQITTLELSASLSWWQHTSRVLAGRLPIDTILTLTDSGAGKQESKPV